MKNAPFERKVFINLVELYGKMLNEMSDITDHFGITISQFHIMDTIVSSENARMQLSEIGQWLLSRKPDVTRKINRMEALDLVRRVQDENDRRIFYVELTEKGAQILESLDPHMKKIHREQFSSLSKDELELLNEFLIKGKKCIVSKFSGKSE